MAEMEESQNQSDCNNPSQSYSATSNASRKLHVTKKRSDSRKTHGRKTSQEDLADEGFLIGRELGEGSYSKVRMARYRGEDIAVKIINRERLSLDFKAKFLPREIETLSKVQHPNIIKVYKIYSYPTHVYIFMECAQSGDILHLVRSRGRLMEEETCHYFSQVVSAISYLHSLNFAHRDLKCENIMIGENNTVKIIDFGFSRSTVDRTGRRELSETYCGSTAYAAPEVLRGMPYNPMMYDVWSLGCILFIMMTGTMPFDDTNVRKMVACQINKKFKYPSTFHVPKKVKKIISWMLEPDVTRRANMKQISHCSWIEEKGDFSQNQLRAYSSYSNCSDPNLATSNFEDSQAAVNSHSDESLL